MNVSNDFAVHCLSSIHLGLAKEFFNLFKFLQIYFSNPKMSILSNSFFFISFILFVVAIELIVQHIRDFLNNRGRCLEPQHFPTADEVFVDDASSSSALPNGKKRTESFSQNLHRPH